MKKLIENYVNVGVYHVDVILLIGPRELVVPWIKNPEHVKTEFQDELLANVVNANRNGPKLGSTFFVGTGGASIIWLPLPADPAVFTHEVSHAAYHILHAKGITLCNETDEVYAYLVEYLWKKLNPFDFRPKQIKK